MGAPAGDSAMAPVAPPVQGDGGGPAQAEGRVPLAVRAASGEPTARLITRQLSSIPSLKRNSLGLAVLDSGADASSLKHISSKDDLDQAFRKREVAVAALKAKMSKVCAASTPAGSDALAGWQPSQQP
jgi:hypothetical protein